MKTTIALAAALVVSSTISIYAGVVVGPVTNAANGHLYYLLTEDTWQNSEAQAAGLGGHLVTINDQAEQDWVFSTFGSFGGTNRSIWIGLREVEVEGNYQWVSGEPLAYTDWAPGEPSNACGGQEAYVQMVKTDNGWGVTPGQWNDITSPTALCWTYYDPVCGVVEVASSAPCEPSESTHYLGKTLAGSWVYQCQPCAIFAEDPVLLLVNEWGELATGRVLDSNTIVILHGTGWQAGLVGTVIHRGRTINWSNGTTWTRPSPPRQDKPVKAKHH